MSIAASDLLAVAVAHHRAGRIDDAEPLYEEVLRAEPRHADVLHFLGLIALARGDTARAVARIRAALDVRPDTGVYRFNLGVALKKAGDISGALASFRAAIAFAPDLAEAHNNLGNTLRENGDPAAAVESLRQAIALKPDYAEAYINLGGALQALGRFEEAAQNFRAAIGLAPNLQVGHYNLGVALHALGQFREAQAAMRRAVELQPNAVDAWRNLALLAPMTCDYATSYAAHREAMRLDPGQTAATLRRIAVLMLYDVDATPDDMWRVNADFGAAVARTAPADPTPPRAAAGSREKLRIGWVSSDFRDHPVARNVWPYFTHRDPKRFEFFCYAHLHNKKDSLTEWFKARADGWRDITATGDADVAAQIRADQVDIAIYLAGRFDENRVSIAAWRPTPVQVSFHDPGTSGMDAMDYLIADSVLAPRGGDERFIERVVRLPHFYVHPEIEYAPEVSPPPHRSGRMTFGSFNNPAKLNPAVLAAWARILRAVPGARLLLHYRNQYEQSELRERVTAAMATHGVPLDSVEVVAGNLPSVPHLRLYEQVDIALDPFPFNGSTTTFEALWMGAPVIALLGRTFMARVSAAMLHAARLDELVSADVDDYVARAVALAADRERLSRLRAGLRDRLAKSSLCDGLAHTRRFERLMAAMSRRHVTQGASHV